MKKTTRQILDLFFNKGETICISPGKYGYHSINMDDINGEICLVSPKEDIKPEFIKEDDIALMAINPISGFRRDDSVTAFRSFLVEIDEGDLASQKAYIDSLEMPYSICIFSGNKSLHYGIVLKKDLISISLWRTVCQWILNIVENADQLTKNPSRSIRFPGHQRKDGKKLKQAIVDINDRISQEELFAWLNKWPHLKPKPALDEKKYDVNNIPTLEDMPPWFFETLGKLKDQTQGDRNNTWFLLACKMAAHNFTLEEMIAYLQNFFEEESDFKQNEWLTCIKSGYKRMQ